MHKYYNETLGFYESPFFRLHVETTSEPLDLNHMEERDAAVFIHEYIHFLQAVSTIYGLNQIHITVEYIRDAINWIYSHPRPSSFKVPIKPQEMRCKNVYYNWRIFKLTQGDSSDWNNISSITAAVPIQEEIAKNCKIPTINSIMMSFHDNEDNEEYYIFGSTCIMESMAYMLEKYISPKGYIKSSDLPYNSALLLANKIHPNFAQNPLNILALCDCSLQTSNPGLYFFQSLTDWGIKNYTPSTPDEIYDNFYKLSWKTSILEKNDFISHLTSMMDIVRKQLREYFKPDESNPMNPWSIKINNIRGWIDDLLDTAIYLRKEHKTFILDLARGGERFENKMLQYIHKELGVPFCINKIGKAFVYHKKFQPKNITNLDYFMAISQIFNTLNGAKRRCELFQLCKISGKKTKDSLCDTPWVMFKTEHYLCPYALMWHHWHLDGYIPDFE